jgi:hypothetical protein
MSLTAIVAGAAFGAIHGARHALEPDHLAAVSTLVTDTPGGVVGVRLGALWGLGHTISLVALAAVVAAAGDGLSASADTVLQLVVGISLLALGGRSIARAAAVAPARSGARVARRWPFYIGLLHGLAGSGALTALAIAEMPSSAGRLAFLVVFGIGSIGGMAAMSGMLGAPLARAAHRPRLMAGLTVASGLIAVGIGGAAVLDAAEALRAGTA